MSAAKRARKIARKDKRAENGDFSSLVSGKPLDTELRRLYKPLTRAKKTRKSAKT